MTVRSAQESDRESWERAKGATETSRDGPGRCMEAWARSRGCSELWSDTELDNAASAEAHQALGFTETGTIRCFRKAL
jgi:hypothetical protein